MSNSTGARKAAPKKAAGPRNAATPGNNGEHNWRAEAEFWQLKYFEQLIHSTQIITALNRPMIGSIQQLQGQAAQAAANANGVGVQ